MSRRNDVVERWRQASLVAAGLIAFVLLWEFTVRALGVKPYILPAPSVIPAEMFKRWPTVLTGTLYTGQAMLMGFAVSVVIGVVLAVIVSFSRRLEALIYPVVLFLQIVPKIAVLPLFLIWIGYGMTPKVLAVFLLSFFPVLLNSIQAFKSVDPEIMDLARSAGASRLRIFHMVQLPHALPLIFTGVKVAAALAATAAVVAEFVASDRGLGYMLLEYTNNNRTEMTFGVILVLCVMGLLLYGAVELVERFAIPWHVSRRGNDAATSSTI
jgi:NitT/TauT family transport system permease protein